MRIIIETGGAEGVSVTQETAGASAAVLGAASLGATGDLPEAIDGGGPPEDLVELLTGEVEGETEEVEPEDLDDGSGEEDRGGRAPDDGGGVPAWLVEVIEGSEGSLPEGGLTEEAYADAPEDE